MVFMGKVALAVLATAALVSAAGCSSSDSTTTSGGTSGTSGTSGGSTDTLYARLGGKSGINTALTAILAEELKDPDIASYFAAVGKPGHPASAAIIQECLVNQLGAAAGGPASEVTYPTTVSGFTCRDMTEAHAKLGIPGGTFDKFVTIAAGVLKSAGVADADITTIGGVLNSTKGAVVTDSTRTSGPLNKDAN